MTITGAPPQIIPSGPKIKNLRNNVSFTAALRSPLPRSRSCVGIGARQSSLAGELRETDMQYAILCYHDEKVTCAWSKEHDDAVMAKLEAVMGRLERQGKLGPV